jgi:hypothetical protein
MLSSDSSTRGDVAFFLDLKYYTPGADSDSSTCLYTKQKQERLALPGVMKTVRTCKKTIVCRPTSRSGFTLTGDAGQAALM